MSPHRTLHLSQRSDVNTRMTLSFIDTSSPLFSARRQWAKIWTAPNDRLSISRQRRRAGGFFSAVIDSNLFWNLHKRYSDSWRARSLLSCLASPFLSKGQTSLIKAPSWVSCVEMILRQVLFLLSGRPCRDVLNLHHLPIWGKDSRIKRRWCLANGKRAVWLAANLKDEDRILLYCVVKWLLVYTLAVTSRLTSSVSDKVFSWMSSSSSSQPWSDWLSSSMKVWLLLQADVLWVLGGEACDKSTKSGVSSANKDLGLSPRKDAELLLLEGGLQKLSITGDSSLLHLPVRLDDGKNTGLSGSGFCLFLLLERIGDARWILASFLDFLQESMGEFDSSISMIRNQNIQL